MNKLTASNSDLDKINHLMKFLIQSFSKAKFGELDMDDCISSLEAVLSTAKPIIIENKEVIIYRLVM